MERVCIAIDLKSFYASVECMERGLDPMGTHLVVADPSRTEKTICLAVSPSLRALGIPGRPRLFEVLAHVRRLNVQRLRDAVRLGAVRKSPEDGEYHFSGASSDPRALEADPSLELTFLTAPPRMKAYETISTQIFSIYSRYVAPEDIHVYSIDECLMEATRFLKARGMTGRELAGAMIRDVYKTTGITATAGIGTNLYLCKVAMDILAKHARPDEDGVRIAELTEQTYRELLWCHTPLTDFWRVGSGTARRLEKLGCSTMGDVARMSLTHENALYQALGVNAELLIDHAWGWEPVEVSQIKAYRPENNSLSSGQVLPEPYSREKGRLIVREMTEVLSLDLVRRHLVTRKVELTINYDASSLRLDTPAGNPLKALYRVSETGEIYTGEVTLDRYGKPQPRHAHGTGHLDRWSSSSRRIAAVMMELYDRIVAEDLLIRFVNVAALDVIPEDEIPMDAPQQLDLFTDYEALEERKKQDQTMDEKERRLQQAAIELQERFGRNAILKGMNLQEGATTMERNGQVGGHRAE